MYWSCVSKQRKNIYNRCASFSTYVSWFMLTFTQAFFSSSQFSVRKIGNTNCKFNFFNSQFCSIQRNEFRKNPGIVVEIKKSCCCCCFCNNNECKNHFSNIPFAQNYVYHSYKPLVDGKRTNMYIHGIFAEKSIVAQRHSHHVFCWNFLFNIYR